MTILTVLFCILVLVLLITWARLNAFLALLLVSILAGLMLGIPLSGITQSLQRGIGDTLGSLVIIISLGAMLGKLVAESGAARKISTVMMQVFGRKYIRWGLMVTGFIVGIPLFYNVGFVLMVPLIFSVVYQYKLPAVYIGLPMLASLSVTHGFLPPHPSPVALIAQLHANMGMTLLYGLLLAAARSGPPPWWLSVAYGTATTVLPAFWMFPSMGFGLLGLKAPAELLLLRSALLNHAFFGAGIAVAMRWIVFRS